MVLHLWDRIGTYPKMGSYVHKLNVKSLSWDITGVTINVCQLPDVKKHFERLGFTRGGTSEVKMTHGQFIDLIEKVVE